MLHSKPPTADQPSQEVPAHFAAEVADFDKKFHWMTLSLDEADELLSTLVNAFKQYDHRLAEARSWLDQSQLTLQERLEEVGNSRSLDQSDAEKQVEGIQVKIGGWFLRVIFFSKNICTIRLF